MLTEQEYISVTVHNPTIHNTYEDGRFTTFDVELQTNSLSFTTKHSVVQRRYSDFQWLRKALSRTTGGSPPSLPFGKIFGTFDEEFLNERQKVLTDFMQKVVRDTLFVSSSALHLFLQTELSRKDMDALIKEAKRRGSMNAVARAISMYGSRYNKIRTRHSVACLVGNGTSFSGRSIASKSVPSLKILLPKRESLSPFGSSESDLSTCSINEHSSSTKQSRTNGSPRAGGNFFIGQNNPYTEENYGDWVLIKDKSPTSSNSLNNSTARQSPINCGDYTDVSWTVEDNPNPLESFGTPTKHQHDILRSSDFIPVPFTHRLKNLIAGQFISRSLDSDSTHILHGPDSSSSDSETARKGNEMRRVASDTNVTEKYIESPPFQNDESSSKNFCYYVQKNSNSLVRRASCEQSTPKAIHSSQSEEENHSDSIFSCSPSQDTPGSVLSEGKNVAIEVSNLSQSILMIKEENVQLQMNKEAQNTVEHAQNNVGKVKLDDATETSQTTSEEKDDNKGINQMREKGKIELKKENLPETNAIFKANTTVDEPLFIVNDSNNAVSDDERKSVDVNKLDVNSNKRSPDENSFAHNQNSDDESLS